MYNTSLASDAKCVPIEPTNKAFPLECKVMKRNQLKRLKNRSTAFQTDSWGWDGMGGGECIANTISKFNLRF